MWRSTALLFLLGLGSVVSFAQNDDAMKFEVASVRPAGPDRDGPYVIAGDPGTGDHERITLDRVSLLQLVVRAYPSLSFDQISGPDWISTEYFAVAAKVLPGTTKDQVKFMWRNLLSERFGLQAHLTTKDFLVYELSLAKGGPKFRKSIEGFSVRPGFPVPPAGSRHGLSFAPIRNVRQTFLGYSMKEFCQQLAWHVAPVTSGWAGAFSAGRVVDKTGLDGSYDFTLEFAGRYQSGANPPPLPDGETDTAPLLFDALREQLGLELEEKKTKLDSLVIDHIDKVPMGN